MAKFKLIDITGRKFNQLTVISLHSKGKRTRWNCICDCGNKCVIEAYSLKNGTSKSCGCFRSKQTALRHITHGLCKHPLFFVWAKMKDRCNNPKIDSYKNYGGRGIHVCPDWNNNFLPFYEWSIKNGWEHGLEIDRIENDNGYFPGNCRFVTTRINANNKRNNVKIELNGILYGNYELEKISGISGYKVLRRIKVYGWTAERAISTPLRLCSIK